MISYSDEYSKVYSYKYRHKIYDETLHPTNLNLIEMFQINNHNNLNRVKSATETNFFDKNNENNKEMMRSKQSFSSYLKKRYPKLENKMLNDKLLQDQVNSHSKKK